MSRTHSKNRNLVMEADAEARRQGRFRRAEAWSSNGERKSKKRRRQEGKRICRKFI